MFKKTTPTILIISDDYLTKKWLKKQLSESFNVIEKEDEEDAIEIAETNLLELIIIDSHIDGLDVLQFCKELKKNTYANKTPIILITDKLKKSFRKKAKQAGVYEFMHDELDVDELFYKIKLCEKGKEKREKVNFYAKGIKLSSNDQKKDLSKYKINIKKRN
jgi:DNA-binding response OmpR family regulator